MSRTKGSKNRATVPYITDEEVAKEMEPLIEPQPVKRGRGRPKGSYSKKKTVAEKALATRQGSSLIHDPKTEEDMAFNTRLVRHIMGIKEIARHADRHDLNTLKSCFVAYLQLCEQDGFTVNNLSAYASIGMDYNVFRSFEKRDDPEIREFCSQVKQTCAIFRESLVQHNKLNPVIGIFWQRNFDGLRNDTEQIQSALEQDDTYTNGSKAYKEKYRNLIGE